MIDLYSETRAEKLGKYLSENGVTVRACAAHFGVSKSTVHKDLTYKLPYINHALYLACKDILEINKSERHIRGGEATRRKYLKKKE